MLGIVNCFGDNPPKVRLPIESPVITLGNRIKELEDERDNLARLLRLCHKMADEISCRAGSDSEYDSYEYLEVCLRREDYRPLAVWLEADRKAETARKEALRASAKAKLTEEEREAIGLK